MPAASIPPARPCRRRAVPMGSEIGASSIATSSPAATSTSTSTVSSTGASSLRAGCRCRRSPRQHPTDRVRGTVVEPVVSIARPGHGGRAGLCSVPEGDTIHRVAAALRTALTGRATNAPMLPACTARDPPWVVRDRAHRDPRQAPREIVGTTGLVLHTHLRMNGSWHLYRGGERWRRPTEQMRVVIEVPDWVAVCFSAPTETYREFDRFRHPGFGRPGPTRTASDDELMECARRILDYPSRSAPSPTCCSTSTSPAGGATCTAARSCGRASSARSPTVGSLLPADCVQVIHAAPRMLRSNLQHVYRVTASEIPGGLAVYGRNGQRCARQWRHRAGLPRASMHARSTTALVARCAISPLPLPSRIPMGR